jgi:hypothetical protein
MADISEAYSLHSRKEQILQLLRKESAVKAAVPMTIPRSAASERRHGLLLSFPQEHLWLLDELGLAGAAYNVPLILRMTGKLDVAALERSFAELVRRHESLRTRIETVEGRGVQVIDEPREVRLETVDLSSWEKAAREEEMRRLANEEGMRPFDLARGPLFRVALLKAGEREHVLCVTMHHIVSDGWSLGVVLQELSALYGAYAEGRASPLAELEIQYADYTLWQREWLKGEVLEGQLKYWRECWSCRWIGRGLRCRASRARRWS